MLPTPENYAIFPSVVQANTPTKMTIVPREKAFLFVENQEYELTLIPVNGDELKYRSLDTPQTHKKMNVFVLTEIFLTFLYMVFKLLGVAE